VHHIKARNVNEGLCEGLHHLFHNGIREDSRNGPVLVAPGPVCTTYERPTERVLFSPTRNANPFFHLMEALWMLAGRNDLDWPVRFNKGFSGYSDDGKTCWGAYGWRWRSFFGYDQITAIVEELKANPASRRCVLSMWNASSLGGAACSTSPVKLPGALTGSAADLHVAAAGGKDVPCNTHAYLDRRGPGGALNMTVLNRSNDIIWGCYGANAVHFSVLLEYLAAAIGCPVGVYRQVSNNFHMYTELYPQIVTHETMLALASDADISDRYMLSQEREQGHFKLVHDNPTTFAADLRAFMADPMGDDLYTNPFFDRVGAPMYTAWHEFKAKRHDRALHAAQHIEAWDWRVACVEWLQRAISKREAGNG
jgi:hypothetical protein